MEIVNNEKGFSLNTIIDFTNAMQILHQGIAVIERCPNNAICDIDLMNLQEKNTVVLAIMVAWLRSAKKRHIKIRFINMTDSMRRMVKNFGLSELMVNG